jgi:hypothetical protein
MAGFKVTTEVKTSRTAAYIERYSQKMDPAVLGKWQTIIVNIPKSVACAAASASCIGNTRVPELGLAEYLLHSVTGRFKDSPGVEDAVGRRLPITATANEAADASEASIQRQ